MGAPLFLGWGGVLVIMAASVDGGMAGSVFFFLGGGVLVTMAVSGSFFGGLAKRGLSFGVCLEAPDFWKLPNEPLKPVHPCETS